ncbi:HAD family hydrolase [Nocardia farcinica]|uniref:HAD family hydrolase n=1 Tax=Nocardia farcinica TaxID=37329 RepID=UPI001894A7BA|nr:HAD-IA family hydrolase [Nocardia farcinica]MBF6231559.1 HAD family hydrolase [Nocardia farcinica]MCZ9328692.1 HAD-IA family hydrolase [Nocardia farcinica]
MTSLLTGRRCLLLDFDGPVCSVFAGLPDHVAAAELAAALDPPAPATVRDYTDPFDVLRYAAEHRPDEAAAIESRFTDIERRAVACARPTPDAAELIYDAANRPATVVAIVSNNSVAAIDAYLTAHGLRTQISGIFARTCADVSRLKPAPTLLLDALDTLNIPASNAVFVGDSITDVQAGQAAGVPVIAFANRPDKVHRLTAARPAEIVTSMAQVRDQLAQ